MDIAKQLKDGRNPQDVARKTINFMRRRSGVMRTQVLLQWIIDTAGSSYIVSESDVSLGNFGDITKIITEDMVIQDFNSEYFQSVSEYISGVVKEGRRLSVLFRSDWLKKITLFLLAMSQESSMKIKSLASFLSIEFLTNLVKLLQDLSVHQEYIRTLTQSSVHPYEDADLHALTNLCHNLLSASEEGTSCKSVGSQIVKKICHIHETTDIFYQFNNECLFFYIHCIGTKDTEITTTALGSIQKILQNDQFSENSKMKMINFLFDNYNAGNLINLILDGSAKTQIEALILIKLVHQFVNEIDSWGVDEYNHLYYKTFQKNKEIRSIAGEIFLKRLEYIHQNNESEILLELMEFFTIYNSNPEDLPNYVDAVWQFEYMKNFENISVQYQSVLTEDISKVMTGHFIKAILMRMKEDKGKYDENIFELIKKLPLILESLENFPTQYASLLGVFSRIELKVYNPITIGHERYIRQLVKTLSSFIRKKKDYVFTRNALYHLKKLSALEFIGAQCEIDNIAEEMYNNFIVADAYEMVFEDNDADIMIFGHLAVASSHLEFFAAEHENDIFDRLREYFQKPFEELSILLTNDNQQGIIAFKIESFSAILQKKVMKNLYDDGSVFIESILVETLKGNIRLFIELLQKLIVKNLTLFLHEKVFSALIDILLTCQEALRNNVQGLAKILIVDVSTVLYGTIIDFVKERVFVESSELVGLNAKQKLTQLEHKRTILEKLIILHAIHTGLPQSASAWKLMIYFGDKHNFQDEIENLAEKILNYKTNAEPKFARFCKVVAVFIHHSQITGLTTKINKLLTFIKKNIDDHQNVKIICSGILMQLIELLAESLRISCNAIDPISSNRLQKLKYLNPFVRLLDNVCRKQVKTHSQFLRSYAMLTTENQSIQAFQRILN